MPRRKVLADGAKATATDQERLAALLVQAQTAAYVATNQHHDSPYWRAILATRNEIGRYAYLAIAGELLRLGVKAPPANVVVQQALPPASGFLRKRRTDMVEYRRCRVCKRQFFGRYYCSDECKRAHYSRVNAERHTLMLRCWTCGAIRAVVVPNGSRAPRTCGKRPCVQALLNRKRGAA